jgi:hypothetical protein
LYSSRKRGSVASEDDAAGVAAACVTEGMLSEVEARRAIAPATARGLFILGRLLQ